jgi:excisionase family DNA binding protein
MTTAPDKLAYSVPDAAKELSVSKETVWRLVKRGELRTLKIGHRTIIRRAEIVAYLDRLEQAA